MERVGCNVLIVDDDADTREALAAALADAGFHVEQADSGKQALECMEKQGRTRRAPARPAHAGDGRRAADGADARFPDAVLVLTGDSSARLIRFARSAKLLAKPIDLDELEKAVEEACAA